MRVRRTSSIVVINGMCASPTRSCSPTPSTARAGFRIGDAIPVEDNRSITR